MLCTKPVAAAKEHDKPQNTFTLEDAWLVFEEAVDAKPQIEH